MIEIEPRKMEGGFLIPEREEVPINKWQLFKQKYFPLWLLRIFPIKMVTIRWAEMLKDHLAEEEIRKYWTSILHKEALKIDRMFMNQ